ncbi:hypothetical protein EUU23_00275 [Sphingorhabdus sp. IMCC26285]|jgi:hypothetical protein|uniref:DUF481 domain-containing protein n=1 Tax=Sphingorhabdus profundilacus TaxID=2509718 RepID=A0A6I4LVP9_9SPHN|nr:hypothetical protein [Sphingorhabdus profundilacus]MVZ96136.1 hypothetical protein [Sphingorhabdus profundilacus]
MLTAETPKGKLPFKSLFAMCATIAASHSAIAHAENSENLKYIPPIEDDERIIDGLSFSPVFLNAELAGFELELDTSIVREARPPIVQSSNVEAIPGSMKSVATSRPSRVTDVRVSVRRSFTVTKSFFIDTLARAELPTGNIYARLGRGRTEFMADLGVRAETKHGSIWAGAARKFNLKTQWSTGRDVNEVYGGWNLPIGKSQNLRMDFVKTGKREYYLPKEQSLSFEFNKDISHKKRIAVYAGRYKGPWGNDVNVGGTLRFKF